MWFCRHWLTDSRTVKEFQLIIPLARSWIWRSVTIRLCHNKKKLMMKVLHGSWLHLKIYENWVRKWAQWYDIGTSIRQGKLKQGGVVHGWQRLYSSIYVGSDTWGSCLRSFWNSDKTYNDSSNIDWSRNAHAAIRVKIWWIINTRALPSKDHLAWCPAANYDSRLYTLIHQMQ